MWLTGAFKIAHGTSAGWVRQAALLAAGEGMLGSGKQGRWLLGALILFLCCPVGHSNHRLERRVPSEECLLGKSEDRAERP